MHRDRRFAATAGAILGGLAVACGAFGAHALKARLDAEALAWWHTAAQYQMWHALALLALAALPLRARLPAMLFAVGTIIFSGSLYVMALTGARWLGAVTPIGGTALIAGWIALLITAQSDHEQEEAPVEQSRHEQGESKAAEQRPGA